MLYEVHGPLKLPRNRNRLLPPQKKQLNKFWDTVDTQHPGLAEACGCYLFGIRAGRGLRIWYVGQANRQSFRHECLTLSKIALYNDAIASRTGTPVIFLVARRTRSDRAYSKPSRRGFRDIAFLEDYFIGAALVRNDQLLNQKGTKLFKEIVVPGFLNPPQGPSGNAAVSLRRALRL